MKFPYFLKKIVLLKYLIKLFLCEKVFHTDESRNLLLGQKGGIFFYPKINGSGSGNVKRKRSLINSRLFLSRWLWEGSINLLNKNMRKK